MNQAKIRLSSKEMELITNADWILTKNQIIEKIIRFFSALQQEQRKLATSDKNRLKERFINSSPKISKGENYQGLPYVVLDYPRFFDKEGFGAIRTLFWWGNFFSTTLHISGNNKDLFADKVLKAYKLLQEKDFYFCINHTEWQHDFSPENYVAVNQLPFSEYKSMVQKKTFLKLSKVITLDQWEAAEKTMLEDFKTIAIILAD